MADVTIDGTISTSTARMMRSIVFTSATVGYQFFIDSDGLSCQLYQRSADMFLGVPFNIASYALLTHLIAHDLGIPVSRFIWVGGDCHIYSNHMAQVRQQLVRPSLRLPIIQINPDVRDVFAIRYEDIQLIGYEPHPAIKGEVAV